MYSFPSYDQNCCFSKKKTPGEASSSGFQCGDGEYIHSTSCHRRLAAVTPTSHDTGEIPRLK